MLDGAIQVVHNVGITLAVGASTFAIIFYFKAIADNVIDATERSFLHVVYFVLRIGLIVLILAEGLGALLHLGDGSYFTDPDFLMRVSLLSVIVLNAVLMQFHRMPMWLGPAVAAGSWYSFYALSIFTPTGLPYAMLFSAYLSFVAVGVIGLHLIKTAVQRPYKRR